MALLTRVAQSSEGAKVLLQVGLLSRLAECTFLDQRPELDRRAGLMSTDLHVHDQDTSSALVDSFVPTVMERYRQLLMPALKVSLAMLTSFGSQAHKELASKVYGLQFLNRVCQSSDSEALYRFHNAEPCYLRYNIFSDKELNLFLRCTKLQRKKKVTIVSEGMEVINLIEERHCAQVLTVRIVSFLPEHNTVTILPFIVRMRTFQSNPSHPSLGP